jgi:ferrous iron transport protein B
LRVVAFDPGPGAPTKPSTISHLRAIPTIAAKAQIVASKVNSRFIVSDPDPLSELPVSTSLPSTKTVVLLGNPNVGKSALFNALTGRRVTVSNYPGTTVEVSRGALRISARHGWPGEWGAVEVFDSPGVNSLVPLTEDEGVTRDLVRAVRGEPGAIVLQVADAKNLRRALLLTMQLGQLGIPAVLVLNMADEAAERGIHVDVEALSLALGIPVQPTVATRGEGVPDLLRLIPLARPPLNHYALPDDAALIPAALLREAPGRTDRAPVELAAYNEAMLRHAEAVERRVTTRRAAHRAPAAGIVSRLSTHPVWGWPILAAVLLAVYEVVGVFGAGTLVDLLEDGLFRGTLNPWAVAAFSYVPSPLVRDAFVGEYGAITVGLTYGLAIVLPIVTTFFVLFGVLEDSGYLPRLAVMADRAFGVMGLNGKAVLPMVLGLGCDTMATMTTRILPTRKERLLATLLLALGVPCSAQLGVLLAMLAAVPLSAGLVWLGSVAGVMIAVGALGRRLLPGRSGVFLLELPPMRVPSLANVLAKTAARVEWYLKEALPLFVLGTLLLFTLDRLGLLEVIVRAGEPVVTGLLGLPPEAASAFLIGFLRRDFAATRLFDMSRGGGLDTVQLVVAMVTITLFIPCIANVFIIAKERGVRTALAMAAFIFPLAFAVGGAVRLFMRGLGLWNG